MKKLISGKVREVYEVSEDRLVIVTTDRISAFDVILPKTVPDKGKILNEISLFWFDFTEDITPNHIISADSDALPEEFRKSEFEGRTVLVKKLKILPFEFIVRGYMFGSMWRAYSDPENKEREFCGHRFDKEYELAERLSAPMFTPSSKAHTGHDENVPIDAVKDVLGDQLTEKIEEISMKLYDVCYNYAYSRGIIIADTKFEFGLDENGGLVLADEIFTPDSSRFWSLPEYSVGISPKSYDKQLLRDWLLNNKVDGEMRHDSVPDEILEQTAEIYDKCMRRLKNVQIL